ncbi:MAG: hypothetical protein KDA60_07175, partial [Planctomycetales bacterium]|nr:hypothetical protein [Planctomycetales bacterium]
MSRNDPQLVLSCIVAEDNEPVFPELREKTEQKYSQQLIRGLTLRQLLGREPIRLGIVESRILRFLAKRPYYPFTRRKI